jgi:MFS family permease
VILLLILFVPQLTAKPTAASHRPGTLSVLRSLAHPRRLALASVAALTLAVGQGACYLLPFAVETHELGALIAAIVLVPYVLGSVVGAPLGGALAGRLGAKPVILGALLLGVLACGLAAVSASSIPILAISNVAIGASVNSTLPLVAVAVVSLRTGGASVGAGAAIGGLRVGQSLGPFIGPSVAGWMLARSGPDAAWLAMAACMLLGLVLHALTAPKA